MRKILLYSGGMDSYLIDKLWNPDIKVYIDINTKYSANEIKRLPEDVDIIQFPLGKYEREDSIIPLRNLYFCMVICNEYEGDLEICLGATAGDRVLDKSQKFADKTSDILTYLYNPQHWNPDGRIIKINVDFKKYTKTQLLEKYISQGGDINKAWESSFSCYNPQNEEECWSCKPCFRKFIAFALNGYNASNHVADNALRYIRSEILPLIEKGDYGRLDEEEEILKVLYLYDNRY